MRGIIVTGRSCTCYPSISCCFTAAVAHIPDARTPSQRNKGQWRRGQREQMLCRRELITIVTPLSRPGSAIMAASVCLYSVYRKQERSLFTAALEQTSNVPTAVIRPRPRAGLLSPIPGLRTTGRESQPPPPVGHRWTIGRRRGGMGA